MKHHIYMDYNATSPVYADVIKTMQEIMSAPHNASAVHRPGQQGRRLVENARLQVAALVQADPSMVIFNSGATEGNNTVLHHFKDERVLVSAIEHPAVLEVLPHAERIPVTPDGIVDLDALETLLKDGKPPALVSVMAVNNETGIIQPIKDISALVHKYGALYHCDGVQAAGRIPMDMATMGIDFLTLSAHKIGGPQGVGALILGLCGITPILLHGGGQEKSARAGTENVAGIAGFGLAAKLAHEGQQELNARLRTYQDTIEKTLNAIKPDIHIYGQTMQRTPNTTLCSIPGKSSEALLMALDLDGIAVSNGSACTSGTVKSSHVLKAMGVDENLAQGTLRISTGWATQESDIEALRAALTKILK